MSRRPKQLGLFATARRKARPKTGSVARPLAPGQGTDSAARAVAMAGRKGGFLPHVAREVHDENCPVHVSIRRVPTAPSFRSQRVCSAIIAAIAAAKRRGVRVIEYSIQDNHLHLMVEGRHSADLSQQMRLLFSRIAFAVNAVARRHGKLFRDRHHRRELATPTETRNALVYILFNDRKHHVASDGAGGRASTAALRLDPCSSALWFRDWSPESPPPDPPRPDEPPTSKPLTWLARFGWRRGRDRSGRKGLLRFSEAPRPEKP